MRKNISLFCFLISFWAINPAKADWSQYTEVVENWFEGPPGNPAITLRTKDYLHSCGANNIVDIVFNNAGSENFHVLSSVIITAIAESKRVSFYISGCYSDRANITALKIEQ